jgi:hypothetical protein
LRPKLAGDQACVLAAGDCHQVDEAGDCCHDW